MLGLLTLPERLFDKMEAGLSSWFLPTVARIIFAGTFLFYYWNAAVLKFGKSFEISDLWTPDASGFGQIFPKQAEAVLWDVTQMTAMQKTVVLAGTYAEFILPALIILGLFTRLAALGMVGFIAVQTATDVVGHGVALGSWFELSGDVTSLLDVRGLWIFLMLVLFVRGAGPLSLDGLMRRTWDERNGEF